MKLPWLRRRGKCAGWQPARRIASASIPSADVEHWNGTTWRRVPVPPGTSLGDSSAEPLAASSASDAWIFPGSSAQVGSLWYYVYDYALHWNGTAWHASGFPAKMIVQSAADLGPGDVWAFGTLQTSANTTVPYAARYNGRAWQRVKLPVAPMAIGTVGRNGLWVVGPTVATAAKSAGLLHWNGVAWRVIALPAAISYVDAMTQDGHGGVWLSAGIGPDLVQYWYHYADGHWTRSLVPSPRGYSNMVFGMAWIPGTTSVWADGEADANTGTHSVAVIAKYGV
jgi:hypothetical protein